MITLLVDIILTAFIVPAIPILIGILAKKLYLIFVLIVIFEITKYLLFNSGSLMINFRLKVFQYLVCNSAFYKLTDSKRQFMKTAIELYDNYERNVWKKDK